MVHTSAWMVVSGLLLWGCASSGMDTTIPGRSGEGQVLLGMAPSSDVLARKASSERAGGRLDAAERFARQALARRPEHAGGLVEVARVLVARARGVDGLARAEFLARARRLYGMASDALGAERRQIADEHVEALVEGAAAELEIRPGDGRVMKAEALLEAAERLGPGRFEGERRRLHERLLAVWISRGLEGPAMKAVRRAKALGASGEGFEGASREARWLEETAKAPRDKRFHAVREAMEAVFEDDAESWRASSRWCLSLGALLDAEWAARNAVRHDNGQESWVALAQVLGRAKRWEEAYEAWRAAGEAPGVLRLAVDAFGAEAPKARRDALRAALAKALTAMVEARPERWREAIEMVGAAEPELVASLARLGKRVDKSASFEEVRALRAMSAAPERLDAAFNAAIEALRQEPEGFELGRLLLERRDKERLGALGKGASKPLKAWSEAAMVILEGDPVRARLQLETGLEGLEEDLVDAVRVKWAAVDVLPDGAVKGLEAAVRRREKSRKQSDISLSRDVARLSLEVHRQRPTQAEQAVREWLEEVSVPTLLDLELARAAVGRMSDATNVALAGVMERSGDLSWSPRRLSLLRQLGDELAIEQALTEEAFRTGSMRTALEEMAEKARQDRALGLASRLVSRLHPSETSRFELSADGVRFAFGEGDVELARQVSDVLVSRANGGAARLAVLADLLLENGENERAVGAFAAAAEAGERSSRTMLGWVRAIARGGGNGLDVAINRWLDARSRDVRAVDELARALVDEGQIARAIEVLSARFAATERKEASLFGALAELYADRGELEALDALARAYIASDERTTTRTTATAALKLAESGAREGALKLLGEALAQRPSDTTLLGAEKTIRLSDRNSSDKAIENVVLGLLAEAPRHPETWVKLIGELHAAGRSELAQRIASRGLELMPEASVLWLGKGRIELGLGLREPGLESLVKGLDRSDEPLVAADGLEPVLQDLQWPEGLVTLLRAASGRVPGRSDLALGTARALLDAKRPEEASQIFARIAAENERGFPVIAAEWGRAGYAGRALEDWRRGFGSVPEGDVRTAFEAVVGLMTSRGRTPTTQDLDAFVQRFVASQAALDGTSEVAIAKAYLEAGRPRDAHRWLSRRGSTSTWQSAMTRVELLLDLGDAGLDDAKADALAALREWISRVVALFQAGRGVDAGGGFEEFVERLLKRGRPDLALLVTREAEAALGISASLRFLGARAALREAGLQAMRLELEFPPAYLRNIRDGLRPLAALARELEAMGLVSEVYTLLERVSASSNDREIALGRMRIAARAGYPEVAEGVSQQLVVEMPALNGWLVADSLLAVGMPVTARRFSARALRAGPQGAALLRALAVDVIAGMPLASRDLAAAVDGSLSKVPRLSGRINERALVKGQVLAQLAGLEGELAEGLDMALGAFDGSLQTVKSDPAIPKVVSEVAALLALERSTSFVPTLHALEAPHVDRLKFLKALAQDFATSGFADASSFAFGRALDLEPGDLRLLQNASVQALVSSQPGVVRGWVERAFSEGETNYARFALSEVCASRLAPEIGQAVASALPEALRYQLAPLLALASNDFAALRASIPPALEHGPDPEVMRLDLAGKILKTTSPSVREAAVIALELLEPLIGDIDSSSREALALSVTASLRLADTVRADTLFEGYTRRFPVTLGHAALLVDAALDARDGRASDRLGGLLSRYPSARDALEEVLEARRQARRPVSSEVKPALGEQLGDLSRLATLENTQARTELLFALGRGEESLGLARDAGRRTSQVAVLEVEWLHALGRTKDAASTLRLLFRQSAAGGLFEAEGRLLAPLWDHRLWRAKALVSPTRATFGRALALTPYERRDSLRFSAAQTFGERPSWVDCVARARPPWAGDCRGALSP